MAISILPPAPAEFFTGEEDGLQNDPEGDVQMGEDNAPAYLPKLSGKHIVTPGESITDDPQWMRYTIPTLFKAKDS